MIQKDWNKVMMVRLWVVVGATFRIGFGSAYAIGLGFWNDVHNILNIIKYTKYIC